MYKASSPALKVSCGTFRESQIHECVAIVVLKFGSDSQFSSDILAVLLLLLKVCFMGSDPIVAPQFSGGHKGTGG